MPKSTRPGTFKPGNTVNLNEKFPHTKLVRIRTRKADQLKEISEWLTPKNRGVALLKAARGRQGAWMEMNMSDDLIDEYHESGSGDPYQWMIDRGFKVKKP